jgi:hypothetical protein
MGTFVAMHMRSGAGLRGLPRLRWPFRKNNQSRAMHRPVGGNGYGKQTRRLDCRSGPDDKAVAALVREAGA